MGFSLAVFQIQLCAYTLPRTTQTHGISLAVHSVSSGGVVKYCFAWFCYPQGYTHAKGSEGEWPITADISYLQIKQSCTISHSCVLTES